MHTDTAVCGNNSGIPHHDSCSTLPQPASQVGQACFYVVCYVSSQLHCDEGPKAEDGLLQGRTPLHHAAMEHRPDNLEDLLKHDVDVNSLDSAVRVEVICYLKQAASAASRQNKHGAPGATCDYT